MKRREFIAALGGAATWPLAARAQQGKVWRIGYLHTGFWDSSADVVLFEAFAQQLASIGYIEGKNLIIDKRSGEGRSDRLSVLANELIALHPNVIVAVARPAIAAAQKATSTIPIVMTPSGDPVGAGFVKSLAHPGGNITGLSSMNDDFQGKAVEVLHAIVPNANRVAVLMSSNPAHPRQYDLASTAASIMGLSIVRIIAAAPTDLERAFQDIGKENCDSVFVLGDAFRPTIVTLAAAARIPTLYQYSEFVEAGGLASYGPSLPSIWRRSAQYVDKIFKGADPADLPVEQPTKFELVLNLKTAKSLGLSIPEQIIVRADQVIE